MPWLLLRNVRPIAVPLLVPPADVLDRPPDLRREIIDGHLLTVVGVHIRPRLREQVYGRIARCDGLGFLAKLLDVPRRMAGLDALRCR